MGINYDRIINLTKYIKKNHKESKYFCFEDADDKSSVKFIVDGKKLRLLSEKYAKYNDYDDFHVNVSPESKTVMYYVEDTDCLTGIKDENFGFIDWEEAEDAIYNFLVIDMKNLTTANSSYLDSQNQNEANRTSSNMNRFTPSHFANNSNKDYVSEYKLRDDFVDPLKNNYKEFRTAKSIDHIIVSIESLTKNNRFDVIDSALRWLDFDKLNVPLMLTLLSTTIPIENSLKERGVFYEKVKAYLLKLKPSRTYQLLESIEG